MKALVAEDDRALADIIRLALHRAGYEVTVAHNGKAALRVAEATPFDVVVSDFQMPGLNGEQLLTGIRASGESRRASIFLCSAKSYELDSNRLRDELGLAGVFYKPFSLSELVAAVGEAHGARPPFSLGALLIRLFVAERHPMVAVGFNPRFVANL